MRRVFILMFILSAFVFGCQKNQSTDILIEITPKAAMKAFQEQSDVNKQQKNVIQQISLQMLWDKAFHLNKDSLFVPLVLKDTVYMDDDSNGKVLMNRRMHLIASYDQGWKFTIKALFPDKSSEKYHFSGKVLSTDYFVDNLSYSYFYIGKPLSKNQSISNNRGATGSKKAAYVTIECKTVNGYVNGEYNSSGTYCSFTHGDGGMDGSGPGEWQNFQPDPGGGGGAGGEGDNPNSKKKIENFNNRIDDSELPDCMKQVLADLKNLNGSTVANIIKKFAGEVPGYNLKFVTENFSDPMQVAGTNRNSSTGEMIIGFNVNPTVIGNVTDLALGTTMLHESIHAYLAAFYYNDPTAAKLSYPELFVKYSKQKAFSNGIQHETFAKNFITDIAASIKNYGELKGYNLDKQVYDDIAWKGLVETEAFKSLSETDRDRIIDRIMAEQYDTRKEKNVKQEGTRLGC
ncbi:hypothetical protein [Sphingobacterium anhuiense]|uniref:hypothetical protein n=1 Tax=Sphingobacterium anhuiense TaxID=493780 RepID=UPI003C2E5004